MTHMKPVPPHARRWFRHCQCRPGRLTFSENPPKFLGESRARRKILGVTGREFWDFCIIRQHCSRVHQSRHEKRRDLCHVTQPRASINVSCSRAGQKGATGGPGDHKTKGGYQARRGQQRVPDQGTRPKTGGTERERDSIALKSLP